MKENFDSKAIESIKEKLSSDTGQQLMTLLQQINPQALNSAIQQVNTGDYSKLSQTLAPLLQSEDIQKLLRQMEG